MSGYVQIADGHNNTAGYQRFVVDPWTPRIEPGIQRISMAPSFSEHGWRSVELRWTPKIPQRSWQDTVGSILTACGLNNALSNEVTVSLPTNKARLTFQDYNGLALWDEQSDFEREGRELIIRIIDLEAI